MTSMVQSFPLISVSGEPYERGQSYGRQCAQRIAAVIGYYRGRIRLPESRISAVSRAALTATHLRAPELREEMRGIAQGAGVSELDIGLLNARSELIDADECTSAALPSARLMGQTWDWSARLTELTVLLHVTRPDGLRLLMLVEPGMVGKIGLSSVGLGVCINFLKNPEPAGGGLPFHVLSRVALEAPSADAAVDVISRNDRGCAGHLLVSDGRGVAASIELSGRDMSVERSSVYGLCHTNHYVRRTGRRRGLLRDFDSRARLDRVGMDLCEAAAAESSLQLVLSDSRGFFPVCKPRGSRFMKDPVVTVAVLTMDLRLGRLSVRPGQAEDAPFAEYHV